jgi:uncharacterized protein YndB with AHSA1/START domain
MSTPNAKHGTFTIERVYDAAPARVFRAWTDPEAKAAWFHGPADWKMIKREGDFRVGGQEILHGKFPSGIESHYAARYHEIVKDERLVYVYDMHVNGSYHSASLATVEIAPADGGTRLEYTEQIVFLDGSDGLASREHGTNMLLDQLGGSLRALG